MKNDTVEVKKAYHLLCKLSGHKKFSGVGNGCLQSKTMYYSIYQMRNSEDVVKFKSMIEALIEDNEGSEIKPRLIKEWKVA